ncbi:RPEL repeat [Echinococcus multilocularis]|uniref:RPEL repeat n=1 Tax=Echinococcus multilocularis TaxID=6211 RepID=A0A068XZD2_ECHMU|nr:RPEL repeat [Echinococcus multilocularis]
MDLESSQHKSPSPRACTEVTSICNALKVKELQRAKTADILKRKIERRPDKQVLISRRILKAGASPFIQERCNTLTKNQLRESLNSKLERRPGSLELVEKGVLKVDPGVATLIRGGSIPYPRVSSTSPALLFAVPEDEPITQPNPPPAPPPPDTFKTPFSASRSTVTKSRTPSRSLKDETVISRYGSLVFHNYCPSSAASSNSPSLRINGSTNATTTNTTERLPKHRAREVQQAELLHLEDAAQAHRRLGQEICQMKGRPPHKIAQATQLNPVFQPVVIAQQPSPHRCFVLSSPAHSLQQTVALPSPPSLSPPPPPPPISQTFPTRLFPTGHVFENGSTAVVTLSNGRSAADAVSQQTQTQARQQHQVLGLTPAASLLTTIRSTTSAEPVEKVASLEEIESVWLDLRRLQQDITEEASRIGLNIYSSDGFPGAFTVANSSEMEPNHPACQRLNRLVKEHANLCSLARLLISDRLEFLDGTDLFLLHHEKSAEQHKEGLDDGNSASGNGSVSVSTQKEPVGSELERSLLQSYLCRLGGNYYQRGAARARRARQLSCLASAGIPLSSDVVGVGDNNALLQTLWRNSTIPIAHSDNIFYQQQTCQAVPQKLNESLVKQSSATEAWMDQLCSSAALHTAFKTMSTAPAAATVASVATPILHTTSSMPANLHLVNAPATMLLTPAINDSFFPAPPTVAITTAASAGNRGEGRGAVFLPCVSSGSSGSSGPVLTAESSSCSIPASSNDQIAERTEDGLMAMEFSPSDLNDIPSPPRAETHDISDVQDFLSAFPLDEETIGFGAASPVASSTTTTSFDSRLPPESQFFVQPDADVLWRQGLMDIS